MIARPCACIYTHIFKLAFFFLNADSDTKRDKESEGRRASIVERFRAIIADLRNSTIGIVDGEAQLFMGQDVSAQSSARFSAPFPDLIMSR